MAEYLRTLGLTRGQERTIAAAIERAKELAQARGASIDSNEAVRRIAETWLAHPPGTRRPGGGGAGRSG